MVPGFSYGGNGEWWGKEEEGDRSREYNGDNGQGRDNGGDDDFIPGIGGGPPPPPRLPPPQEDSYGHGGDEWGRNSRGGGDWERGERRQSRYNDNWGSRRGGGRY